MVWLDTVLAAKPAGVPVVVINHTPRYTKGSGHSDNGANISAAWDVLLKYKPDERFFGWLKSGFRTLATRYERLNTCFMGLLNLACFLIYWRKIFQ